MANYVISDEILESLVCSSCSQYLSVKPIKIYPNRQIKCGRCVEDGDNGVNSLYELFAEEILFPCINRYEDCRHLLSYSEVKNHEMKCVSGLYECVICHGFTGSAYKLFKHFKFNHKSNVIYSGEFPINIKIELMEWYYLYRKRNLLLLVTIKCDKLCKELFVNMTFVGPEQKDIYFKYQFILYNSENEIRYTTGLQNCLPFGKDTYFNKIRFSDLQEDKILNCKIKINASECEGLISVLKRSEIKIANEQNYKKLKKGKLSDHSLDKAPVCPVTQVPKLNPPTGFLSMNSLEYNNEIQVCDILESNVRPSFKRKLKLDEKKREILPATINNKLFVSDNETSIIFKDDNTKMEFEMICFGCKQNLPKYCYELDEWGRYSLPLRVSGAVYGCVCPNNTVCEDCFNNWNFKTCKKNHSYVIKIVESTIFPILLYYSWNDKDIFKYSDLGVDLMNFPNVKDYCFCSRGALRGRLQYLDLIEKMMTFQLSVLDIGLLIYHALQCRSFRCNYAENLYWLLPFVTHSIQLSQLLAKSFIAVVDTLIVVERFVNELSTTFKVYFLNEDQNKNKSIVSIIKFDISNLTMASVPYKVFKGEFLIWNTDITKNTLISFRII